MSDEINCVGIDPGATTGAACRTEDGRWWFGLFFFASEMDVLSSRLDFKRDFCSHAIIEDSYLGVNPKTRASIDKKIGYIWALCEQLGYKVEIVPAMTWKSAMLSVNGTLPKKSKEQKEMSILAAKGLGVDTTSNDIADAVCLAEFGNLNFELLAKEIL